MRFERFRKQPNPQPTEPKQVPRPLTATEHCSAILQKLARAEFTPASKEDLLHQIVDHAIAVANAPRIEREKALQMLDGVRKRDLNSTNPTYFADKASDLIHTCMTDSQEQEPKLVFFQQ